MTVFLGLQALLRQIAAAIETVAAARDDRPSDVVAPSQFIANEVALGGVGPKGEYLADNFVS